MTKQKAHCPSRQQWRLLAALRNGPAKHIHRAGKSIRTPMSLRKQGWVDYDKERLLYALSESGLKALAAGDRRYQASEIAYAKRSL